MSFRARLTLVAAAAVALAVVAASVAVYFVVRGELYAQLDKTLNEQAVALASQPLRLEPGPDGKIYLDAHGPGFDTRGYVQAVGANGNKYLLFNELVQLPADAHVLNVARGKDRRAFRTDVTVAGVRLRVLTVPATGYAVQIARSLGEIDHTLSRTRFWLLLIACGGVALAAGLGLAVSSAALRPVRRLTATTESVSETRDLSERIDLQGRDELSRLAGSFNTMLAALQESERAQRQLVADASHELRTPLTSLRTNIEVLASERALPSGDRERLLKDVVEQLGEMTNLVAELIELARGAQEPTEPEDVRLDLVAGDAIERTRRNRPGITFTTDFEETLVHGVPSTIERAVANLLDNAAKWSPPDGDVEVVVRNGEVVVRDHGPGIDEADLPYIFDRFYRAPAARAMPGSGLGLAIVRQVAEAHGGGIVAERAEGGGTRMILRLNGGPPE